MKKSTLFLLLLLLCCACVRPERIRIISPGEVSFRPVSLKSALVQLSPTIENGNAKITLKKAELELRSGDRSVGTLKIDDEVVLPRGTTQINITAKVSFEDALTGIALLSQIGQQPDVPLTVSGTITARSSGGKMNIRLKDEPLSSLLKRLNL